VPTYRGADGAALFFDVLGPAGAPSLVLLAGGAGAHPAYLGTLAGLDERYRLVVPHLRGVGGSAAAELTARGSRWRQAADVEALRRHLGTDRCVLVAHSAGSRLAVAYAAQHPEYVAGLVLVTPPAGYLVDVPSDVPALTARRLSEPVFAQALAAFEAGPDTSSDETFNDWQRAAAPLGYARWDERAQAHARSLRYSMAAARAFMSGDAPGDLLSRLRAVPAPTLVVAGAQDCSAGRALVVAVVELFPAGRAVVLEDCGHFPWVEQPAAFRAALDPFLAQL